MQEKQVKHERGRPIFIAENTNHPVRIELTK